MRDHNLLLGVNIDHVATLRQARGTRYPDPIEAALLATEAGADNITLHLREDRRHIQDNDVFTLKDKIKTRINLEMAMTDEMITLAETVRPACCCLVPERREELTTEGGLDVIGQLNKIKAANDRLRTAGICVSLFIEADTNQVEAAKASQADAIEIHTGHYADAKNEAEQQRALEKIITAAKHAQALGLIVNAGHGLHYQNVKPIAAIDIIKELNIGHSIIARAVFVGIQAAVSEMKQLLL